MINFSMGFGLGVFVTCFSLLVWYCWAAIAFEEGAVDPVESRDVARKRLLRERRAINRKLQQFSKEDREGRHNYDRGDE